MIAFALAIALGQLADVDGPIFSNPALTSTVAGPFFEFAPMSGAGMGSVCACTTPTGSKGEVIAFSRSSVATCNMAPGGGLLNTGIANGDLVQCASGGARVEYDASGYLGLRAESNRTNYTARSEEFNNSIWFTANSGISLPTITANAGTAPSNALTAERIQISGSTTAGQYSLVYQDNACAAGASNQAASVYLRGVSGSGSICLKNGTNVATCSYVQDSWTRCTPSIMSAGADLRLSFGVDVTACGGNAAGVDAYIWGAQCENGAYQTSYIATTGSAGARASETASFTPALTMASSSSYVESFWSSNTTVSCAGFFPFNPTVGPTVYTCFSNGFTARAASGATADSPNVTIGSYEWNTTGVRWGVAFDRSTHKTAGIYNGTLGTYGSASPTVGTASWTAITLTASANGIHSRICADQTLTGCR